MGKTAMIRARVDPELKTEVERTFSELGLTPMEAIRMFYRQVLLSHGLPFPVRIPNETTLRTLTDTDRDASVIRCVDDVELLGGSGSDARPLVHEAVCQRPSADAAARQGDSIAEAHHERARAW